MERLIHKVTVGEWDYFSNTGDFSGMKKHGVNKSNIAGLGEFVFRTLNNEGNEENEKKAEALDSEFKIQELMVYLYLFTTLFLHKIQISVIEAETGAKIKKDERIENILESAKERLKSKFTIEVESLDDIEKIQREINRRIDKYTERFKAIKKEVSGMTFSEIVIYVFRTLGYQKIDYDMKLSGFFHLKDMALKYGRT
jgi:hypothetical protein